MIARGEIAACDGVECVEGHVVMMETGEELGFDAALEGVVDSLVD